MAELIYIDMSEDAPNAAPQLDAAVGRNLFLCGLYRNEAEAVMDLYLAETARSWTLDRPNLRLTDGDDVIAVTWETGFSFKHDFAFTELWDWAYLDQNIYAPDDLKNTLRGLTQG